MVVSTFNKNAESERNMEKKKHSVKKVLLILLAVILLLAVFDIIMTKIYAQNIPHRFANAEDGRALMLANTDYYEHYTQNDIDFRLRKTGGTMDELLEASADSVKEFGLLEKYSIDRRFAKMSRTLKKKGYNLPKTDEIVLIAADMTLESNVSGYTHGTEIYLNAGTVKIFAFMDLIPGQNFLDELLWHEMFHCLTRCDSEFRAQMYSLIHFTVADHDFEFPPCLKEKYSSNPDVEHHNAYASFHIDGKDIDCFPVYIYTKDYAEAKSDRDDGAAVVLVPIDGTDTYYEKEQASNFDEIFGTNTYYVIDPEECLADNFKLAMLYGMKGKNGSGYPNPEIIQGIIDIVSR